MIAICNTMGFIFKLRTRVGCQWMRMTLNWLNCFAELRSLIPLGGVRLVGIGADNRYHYSIHIPCRYDLCCDNLWLKLWGILFTYLKQVNTRVKYYTRIMMLFSLKTSFRPCITIYKVLLKAFRSYEGKHKS